MFFGYISVATRQHGRGWQNPETSAFLSQSEISPRGAPQFPVVLKRIASNLHPYVTGIPA
jgi:hypothetical protein